MAIPNSYVVLPLTNEPKVRPMRPPKGELVNFGINPYQRKIVFSYQSNNVSIEYIDLIIKQLYHQIMAMDDYGLKTDLATLINWIQEGNNPPLVTLESPEVA